MAHRTHLTAAVAALIAVVVLASCSSSGGDTGSSASSTTAAAGGSAGTAGDAGSGSPATAAPTTVVRNPASAGCDSGAAPTLSTDEEIAITAGGTPRTYIRHVPPAHDGTTPVPVVVDLHGYSEGAKIHTVMTQLGVFGDANGFVTITPQGEGEVARWTAEVGSSDVAFIGNVLDDVESTLCVDTNRIFVAGLSNGAFMTSTLACDMSDRFAAAAPVAGIRDIEGCASERPVPVIAFHGTADTFVTYDGSLGPSAANLPAPDGSGRTLGELGAVDPSAKGPTIDEITASWAGRNGCEPNPTESPVADDVTLITYSCPAGADVQLYRVTDGGHSWPGSEFSQAIAATVGRTTTSIDANELMWAFFQAHPLPA